MTVRQSEEENQVEILSCCRGLLAAAKSLGHEDTFYWIASDGWGKQQQVRLQTVLQSMGISQSDIYIVYCSLEISEITEDIIMIL